MHRTKNYTVKWEELRITSFVTSFFFLRFSYSLHSAIKNQTPGRYFVGGLQYFRNNIFQFNYLMIYYDFCIFHIFSVKLEELMIVVVNAMHFPFASPVSYSAHLHSKKLVLLIRE